MVSKAKTQRLRIKFISSSSHSTELISWAMWNWGSRRRLMSCSPVGRSGTCVARILHIYWRHWSLETLNASTHLSLCSSTSRLEMSWLLRKTPLVLIFKGKELILGGEKTITREIKNRILGRQGCQNHIPAILSFKAATIFNPESEMPGWWIGPSLPYPSWRLSSLRSGFVCI